MENQLFLLVALVVGYLLGLLNNGVKVTVQQVPPMKVEEDKFDDKDYPSFIVGSEEHIAYIAKKRRENTKEMV